MATYDQLKVPAGAAGLITPAIESQLNERQKEKSWLRCRRRIRDQRLVPQNLDVVYDTIRRDLIALVQIALSSHKAVAETPVMSLNKAVNNLPIIYRFFRPIYRFALGGES